MIEITSRKNRIILDTLELHDKRGRDKSGLFFAEGTKLLGEALSAGIVPKRIFVTEQYLSRYGEDSLPDTEIYFVTNEVYDKITDENSPQGIFSVFEKPSIPLSDKASCILLLEGIQDPGNLGTLIRCAVAFGVRGVLSVGCADVFSPKTVRAAMGGIFKMSCMAFECIDSAVNFAHGLGSKTVAAALHEDSVSMDEVDTSTAVIMIGNEGSGLSDRALELADIKAIIPIENIESLNASVAGAIFMYDSMTKRKKNE